MCIPVSVQCGGGGGRGGGGSVKECTPVLVFACDSVKCASVFLCVYLRARVDLCRSQTRVA